jgi:hypothetical protein
MKRPRTIRRAIHTLRNYIEDPEGWFDTSLKRRWNVLQCAMVCYDKGCSDGGWNSDFIISFGGGVSWVYSGKTPLAL